MEHRFKALPIRVNEAGQPRRIGIELEFGGIDSRQTASVVQELFGGHITEHDPHAYTVDDTDLGTFAVELDTQFAHPPQKPQAGEMARWAHKTVGDIAEIWMPTEVTAPPVTIERLPRLETLIERLRVAGAEGTDAALAYAFGLQFNPEVARRDVGYVLDHLRAFLLAEPALRSRATADRLRRTLAFVDPFPLRYAERVLDPDYEPAMEKLIDDYLTDNPTRNRGLDLLPLLAELDPARVSDAVRDIRVKSRPTFHYRLPDCRIGDPDWRLAPEWNRWVGVEALACAPDRLREAISAWWRDRSRGPIERWADTMERWLSP